MARTSTLRASSAISLIACAVLERLGADLAGSLEALAEPGHDRPIDDGPPRATPVRVELRDVELDRVRADVDDCVALRHTIDEQPQPRRDV